jgi:hypothetical protein
MGKQASWMECEELFLFRLSQVALEINRNRVQAEETAKIIQVYFPEWKPWWIESKKHLPLDDMQF